jgi:phosphoglycolate phosphatase
MAIRGVLFDKDGTLIDVNGTWVPFYRHILQDHFGHNDAEAEAKMTAAGYDPATNAFRGGSLLAQGTTAQIASLWWPDLKGASLRERVRALDHDFITAATSMIQPLMPLAPVMDDLIAMGLKLGVATNDGEASARSHMTELGIAARFAMIMGADSVASPKPSGDMVRAFALQTGLAENQLALVGDNGHDMEEARNGGAGLAIAVLTGNTGRAQLERLADHVIASVAELPALLRTI